MSCPFFSESEAVSINIEELRDKASRLPLTPGVYLMKDAAGRIIYVGKSKALRSRVLSYFTDIGHHTVKTAKLVSGISDFDVMLTSTEIEALALENRLIKLHTPKFNIKLKDGKSYPYIKLTVNEEYPRILVVRKRLADGAKYFGPYSGTSTAYMIVNTVRKAFGIPDCKKKFPKDIGKTRPCLNYQIGLCCGVCTGSVSGNEYRKVFSDISSFLGGSFSEVKRSLTEQMEYASENLMFEAAALCRDRIKSLSKLWEKQKVVAAPYVEQDIIALYSDETCTCLTVFYVRGGAVTDSESFVFGADRIVDEDAVSSFLYELYSVREYIPKEILLDFPLCDDSRDTLSDLLREKAGYRVNVRFPEKGNLKALCRMVADNAKEYAARYNADAEKQNDTLIRIAQLLGLEVVPERIEAYDISNYGSENITAGKITVVNGRFDKSGYRTYKIASTAGQDDYASMREAISRRFSHPEDEYPDLILLDGGKAHVSVIRQLLSGLGIPIPVFGMVKDEYHKTRALTDDECEISIAKEQPVFLMIYKIQEEIHRFTVSRMTGAKRKSLKTSSLEAVNGIGPAKAKALLSAFGGLSGVAAADRASLAAVKGITEKDAEAVITYFAESKKKRTKTT